MKHWFGLVCFLIVYGSFYPFSFSSGAPSDAHLLALLDFNFFRAGLADAVSNIVLFIPYGYLIASVLKASSAKHAILKTLLPTFAFAYAVQIGQLWVDGRLPWGGDAILNVLGYMIGLVLYLYFSRHFSIRFKVETPIQKVVTFAIATLVLIKLAPFVPSLDMEQLKQSIKQILLRPQVDLFWVFENVVSWLLVFYLSKQFVFKDLPLRAYAKLVIAILCFKFFLVSNNLNLDALLGGLFALAIWWRIGRLLNTQALLILTGCAILGNGLYPFEFSTSASPFNWLPFSGSLAGNVLLNILAVSKKLAFYVCFIVLLMQTKANKYAVFCIPASLVAVSEILQVFVPGSVPESTDVVMVCFLVFVLRRYLDRLTVAEHAGYTPNGYSENEVASNSDAHVTRRKHTDGHHYIAGLDGLRAIAAMSVFVVHFQQFSGFQYSLGWLDFTLLMVNGNTGVALFFVLSGFLLSQPFWRAYQRRTSVALKSYFTNRLARIVPIYYLLFFFLIAIKGFAGPEVNFNNILSHLFFVHNFKDQQVMSLNPPFWTLAVEMQFYLLLPLLFVLLGKLRRISGFWIVLGLVALIYAIYRFGVVWLGDNVSWPISFPLIWPFGVFAQSIDSPAVTYSTLAHLPHFLMGVATSYLFLSNKNFSKKRLADFIVIISSISVVAVLSTSLDSFLTLDFGRYNFPFIPMMLCLIVFFVPVSGVCRQLLELRTIRWLGRISYGLYIFHYPAQKAMLKAMNYLDISMQSNQWLFFTASLLITVLAAYVSYEVIEKPLMRYFKPSVEDAVTLSACPAQTQSSRVIRTANHLIQVRAEKNADYFHLSNCVLQDAYEQLLKVSGAIKPKGLYSDYGIIEGCLFEYTGDVGPQFYIGGIDAHRSRHWLIQNNTFKNIASPKRHIAEHAIHFWNDSSDTIVRNNTILNSDRGIGFGLGNTTRQHQRGVVEGNLIVHTNRDHPFADTGIVLENSPGTVIRDNTILLYSGYPNAIEYRFTSTHGVIIEGNTVNKRITSRDGATATVTANQVVD